MSSPSKMEINDANISATVNLLQMTMSHDAAIRRPAEKELQSVETKQNYPLLLLHIIEKDEIEFLTRIAASITFKNYIKSNWTENDGTRIFNADRVTIKKNIISVMLKKEEQIQRQLSDAVAIIGKSDFPDKWPNLLSELVDRIKKSGGNFHFINGILQTVHSLFKRFRHEFKSDELFRVIKFSLDEFAAPFTDLFVATMNLAASNVNNQGNLRIAYSSLVLCTKVYYSLNVQDLPEFFEDNLDIWMPNFLNILGIENKLLDSCSDDEPGLLEQVKSEICFIISMYAQKYHEEFETYLTPFVEAVWKLLSTCGQEPKFDILVSNSIKFLSTVANREQFRKIFAEPGVLNSLCSRVIIPNIEFRACDIELFEDNGEDFIRSDLEGSDVDTRRKSACELVKALSKHFEEDIVRVFSEYIKLMLDSFASDPNNYWKNKDAAIYLVTAICVKGSTAKHGTTQTTNLVNVVDFYNTFIKGDIDNNNDFKSFPVLRAGALKYIMTFRNQLPFEEIIIPILPTIIKHLSCDNIVVHTYAANTLEKIFTMKTPDRNNLINSDHLSPIIEMLIRGLFTALTFPGSEENEYIMKAIMRTISVSGNAIIPYLPEILPHLSKKLMEVCKNPSKPYFNHYLFESIALILQIAILHNPASATHIENVVFELSKSIFAQDVQEFLPYMLQLLSLLLEQDPNNVITNNYMELLPGLTAPQLWEKTGNIHPLVRFLKAYIRKSPQQVIESGRLDAILGVFQKLVASTANDHEGLDLLQCLFNDLPIEALNSYVQQIYVILFIRLSTSKTPKFVKNLIVFFCFFMFRFGPQALEDIIERTQSKMFGMVIEKLFMTECQKIPSVKDRKIVCIGLTKMITETPSVIEGPYSCFWPRLLEVLIALFELPVEEDNLTEEVIQLGLEEDLGYQTTYSKLIFAPDPQKDIFQGNFPDARIFLAQCLHKLSSEKPGVMTDIISKSIDPNAVVHLKKYLDAANLTLS